MFEFKLVHGCCLEILKTMRSNSVDAVVTDPPYGLRFMNKHWDYDIPTAALWKEVLRVLKPGGHILVACGTKTQHRMAVNIEDAGFEIRDTIAWLYGSGFPKSLDVSKSIDKAAGAEREVIGFDSVAAAKANKRPSGEMNQKYRNSAAANDNGATITAPSTDAAKQWNGWGTALKPALELWTLARKPLSESTVAKNVLKHGTGGINVDGCRVGTDQTVTRRNGDSGGNGAYGRDERVFKKLNPPGRFPANLILGCCGNIPHDEGCAALILDEQSGGKCGAAAPVRKKATPSATNLENYKPHSSVGDDGASFRGDTGGASRFFYTAKASKSERGVGNGHPTVKPLKLMRYLCRLITPPDGIVLDPFMGSGSTGVAAKQESFHFIGIEREAEYIAIAEKRIDV